MSIGGTFPRIKAEKAKKKYSDKEITNERIHTTGDGIGGTPVHSVLLFKHFPLRRIMVQYAKDVSRICALSTYFRHFTVRKDHGNPQMT